MPDSFFFEVISFDRVYIAICTKPQIRAPYIHEFVSMKNGSWWSPVDHAMQHFAHSCVFSVLSPQERLQ